MKKFVSILCIVVLLCTVFTGCGDNNKEEGSKPTNSQSQTSKTTSDKVKEEEKPYQEDKSLPGRLTISYDYLRYQIDGPIINIARIGTGYYADKDDILVVYDTFLPDTSDGKYNADLAKITKPEHVIPEMKAQFKSTVPMQTLAMIAEDFTIESTENVTINGWDMCKTKGHLIFSKDRFKAFVDYKASYVAYSVIKDGYPVYFVVVDNSEEQVKGAELEGMALKVAKTFRDYKE